MRVCVLAIMLSVVASALCAGPQRNARATETHDTKENVALYQGQRSDPLNEDDGRQISNYCYVTAAKNSPVTWVRAEGVIYQIPTTVRYTRNYSLMGWDECERDVTITGCEVGRFVYSAKVGMTVTAEVAHLGIVPAGDVFAKAQGWARVSVDGIVKATKVRECKAGANELESTASPQPAIVSGAYSVDGDPQAGLAVKKDVSLNPRTAKAELVLALDHGSRKSGLTLKLKYKSLALVAMQVPTEWGWALVKVVHKNYPGGTSVGDDGWMVTVDCWDMDDPDAPIHFKQFEWIKWGN